jgi:hypothetical protein
VIEMKWSVHVVAPRDQWISLPGLGTAQTGHELTVEADTQEEAERIGLEQSMYPRGKAHARLVYMWRQKVRVAAPQTARERRRYKELGLRGGRVEEFLVDAADERRARQVAKYQAESALRHYVPTSWFSGDPVRVRPA